jgi:ABC-type multidrug transport system permease subunit
MKNFNESSLTSKLSSSSFTASSFLASAAVISERAEGTWNRVLAAGVDPRDFLISHLIVGFFTSLVQFAEWFGYIFVFLSAQITLNSLLVSSLLLFMNGLAGLCFGLFLSVVTNSVTTSLLVSQNFIYPTNFVSGKLEAFVEFSS